MLTVDLFKWLTVYSYASRCVKISVHNISNPQYLYMCYVNYLTITTLGNKNSAYVSDIYQRG